MDSHPSDLATDPAPLIWQQDALRLRACRRGLFLYSVNDVYVGGSLEAYGEYMEVECLMYDQLLRPGDTAVDVGAHFGTHTIPMAKLVSPGGMVIAFEPQRLLHQILAANVALNDLANVATYWSAVGNTNTAVRVPAVKPDRPVNLGGLSLKGRSQGDLVPQVTLDGLGMARCDLLKIDVEGMELEVLEGAVETIKRLQPIIYIENDRQAQAASLIRWLRAQDYELTWSVLTLFNPDNIRANPENVFMNKKGVSFVNINMICLPRGKKDSFKIKPIKNSTLMRPVYSDDDWPIAVKDAS